MGDPERGSLHRPPSVHPEEGSTLLQEKDNCPVLRKQSLPFIHPLIHCHLPSVLAWGHIVNKPIRSPHPKHIHPMTSDRKEVDP